METSSHTRLLSLASRFILAMMRSASTDVIDPVKWWERAKTALETAAEESETYGQMVASMARKLQIECLTEVSSASICEVESDLGDDWDAWRDLCARDAVYLVAVARMDRDAQRDGETWRPVSEIIGGEGSA